MCCSVSDCDHHIYAKKLCRKHYLRLRKFGSVELPTKIRKMDRLCFIEGCKNIVGDKGAKDMCGTHYKRIKRNGHPNRLNTPWEEGTIHKGYLVDSDFQPSHRRILGEKLGRQLKIGEIVHHIDFNKFNNDVSNLLLCENGEHHKIHGQFNKIVPDLFKLGIVIFENGVYKINSKFGPDASP